MNWNKIWHRAGDAVDGKADGQYSQQDTDARVGAASTAAAARVAERPVLAGYIAIAVGFVVIALLVYAFWK